MEQKKSPKVDIEQRRSTGFLLGLIAVLAVLYVSLEWSSVPATDDVDPIDLSDLMHESELVPMTNEETVREMEDRQQTEKGEQLRVVADDVEVEAPDEPEGSADEDEALLADFAKDQDKPLPSLDVDPDNPLNFHIAEDLPQYPGGAVEFMKWLTRTLKYPPEERSRNIEGKVVAVFYVEKDGTVTGINITKSLTPACDQEVRRVLQMMPKWKPGIEHDQPCRTKVCIPVVFRI